MTCTQYQSDLSNNLDGRLPAGRRSRLLAHLAECAACTRTMRELEQARDLAMSLPAHPVSAGFRDTLWARIESGEAAPEVPVISSVPGLQRVRWFLLGAAAAALLLVAGELLRPPRPEPTTPEVAKATPPEAAPGVTLAGIDAQRLEPAALAASAAASCIDGTRSLQSRLAEVEVRKDSIDLRALQHELDPELRRVRASVNTLRWMKRANLMQPLPPELDANLHVVERSLEMVREARSVDELRAAQRNLQDIRIEPLPRFLFVPAQLDPNTFFQRLQEFYVGDPDAPHFLRMQIQIVRDPAGGEPRATGILIRGGR